MLGPFTFTFTLESEEFEKFEKVACLRICNRPWWILELLTELIKGPREIKWPKWNEIASSDLAIQGDDSFTLLAMFMVILTSIVSDDHDDVYNDGWLLDKFGCWGNFSDTNCRVPQREVSAGRQNINCIFGFGICISVWGTFPTQIVGEKSAAVAKISPENFDHIVSRPFSPLSL